MHPTFIPLFDQASLEAPICECVNKVFERMLLDTVQLKKACTSAEAHMDPKVFLDIDVLDVFLAGSVGFTGSVSILIHLYLSEALAHTLACKMMKRSEHQVLQEGKEIVYDAIGEIINMIAGRIKDILAEQQLPQCNLTIPSIVHGTKFAIDNPPGISISKKRFLFKTRTLPFVLDLSINHHPTQ